jgi:hypothetical protein
VDLARLLVHTGRGDQALPLLEKFTTAQRVQTSKLGEALGQAWRCAAI